MLPGDAATEGEVPGQVTNLSLHGLFLFSELSV